MSEERQVSVRKKHCKDIYRGRNTERERAREREKSERAREQSE